MESVELMVLRRFLPHWLASLPDCWIIFQFEQGADSAPLSSQRGKQSRTVKGENRKIMQIVREIQEHGHPHWAVISPPSGKIILIEQKRTFAENLSKERRTLA